MLSLRERRARAISMKVKTSSENFLSGSRSAVSLPVRVTSRSPAAAFLCSFYPARRCFYVTRSRERKFPRVEVNILLSRLTTNTVAIDYQTTINVSYRGNRRVDVRLVRNFLEICIQNNLIILCTMQHKNYSKN